MKNKELIHIANLIGFATGVLMGVKSSPIEFNISAIGDAIDALGSVYGMIYKQFDEDNVDVNKD